MDVVIDNPNRRCYTPSAIRGVRRFGHDFGAATLVVVVVLAGCSREGVPPTPTAPTSPVADAPAPPAPPPATTGSALLWVMVLPAGSGVCLEGATIQIVG